MKQSTLGLIETYGFIGAVEALDVAAKAANVELVSCEFVKGGIVTIIITGEVASVKASVEAAAIAVEKLGVLRSTHVIARAYDEVRDILQDVKSSDLVKKDEVNETGVSLTEIELDELDETEMDLTEIEDSVNETEVNLTEIEEDKISETEVDSTEIDLNEEFKDKIYTTREELEGMKVTELRTIARGLQNIPLTKKQIKFSKKEQLIEEILKNNRRQDK
ncbi:BMC domain-containing protein [Clostridium aciditolerans]|uniref:BMC domain-containing protein n=1 Tax=Clostridium aciditolerans TaxID=339861 RepID=A0A934HPB2_9CLOT|nr:BMC domain-containing protein [Clostridium aciditolerans]MBI6871941.1 BMC domain-containing protein [Clostridium aciditolerans]